MSDWDDAISYVKLTNAEYRRLATAKRDVPGGLVTMTEKSLQQAVTDLAHLLKWKSYHTFDSRRSAKGFPDLILCRNERIVAIELKSAKGVATVEQLDWLTVLEAAGVECHLLRPEQWRDGTIERILR